MTEQRRFSQLGFAVATVLVVVLTATSGCSSDRSHAKAAQESTTTTRVAANTLRASLRAAAVAWAKAFLTPLPAEVYEMSPQCGPQATPTLSQRDLAKYRDDMRRYVVLGIYDERGGGRTFFDVTVLPRMTLDRNLPDLCK
jgi:uncharacterized protein YceK